MKFKNREDGGRQLAIALQAYENKPNVIVLGLLRGGIVTAFEIAQKLNLPLDVICPRKIGAPFNPELALGAITEKGIAFYNTRLINELGVSPEYIKKEAELEKTKAMQRLAFYRQKSASLNIKDKTVILVDDGIATGATMRAAIKSVKKDGVFKVIVAVPVGAADTIYELTQECDEVVCLSAPLLFGAVGYFYEDFLQVEDKAVIELLDKAKKRPLK